MHGDPKTGLLSPEGDSEFHELINYIKGKKSGYIDMPYQGVDSFWAFAAIFPDLYFVIVVPKSVVMGLPEEIGDMFKRQITGEDSPDSSVTNVKSTSTDQSEEPIGTLQ